MRESLKASPKSVLVFFLRPCAGQGREISPEDEFRGCFVREISHVHEFFQEGQEKKPVVFTAVAEILFHLS